MAKFEKGKAYKKASRLNPSDLNYGAKVYERKRKLKDQQIEEIKFDDEARSDYLTGFQKRNQERRLKAQTLAKERERLEKIEMRKEQRQERLKQLNHSIKLQELEKEAVADVLDEDNSEPKSEADEETLEFGDSEVKTTVTLVSELFDEESGPAFLLNRMKELAKGVDKEESEEEVDDENSILNKGESKKKGKKFRYETKRDRAFTNHLNNKMSKHRRSSHGNSKSSSKKGRK